MAGRYTDNRRQLNTRSRQPMYVYGNAVPNPGYETPERHVRQPRKKVSRQVKKNRKNALHMSAGYVVFLTVAAILALVICVNYVRLQSRLTGYSKNITALQEELSTLKEENNTKYNSVMDSVNLEEVRKKARKDLGMVYASPDQIQEYEKPSSDYMKQYEDIPKDGVLARSDKE